MVLAAMDNVCLPLAASPQSNKLCTRYTRNLSERRIKSMPLTITLVLLATHWARLSQHYSAA
jgi:hypothetical protein